MYYFIICYLGTYYHLEPPYPWNNKFSLHSLCPWPPLLTSLPFIDSQDIGFSFSFEPQVHISMSLSPCLYSLVFLSSLDSVQVNFMCRQGRAMVARYVVKHYSGCFHEGVFG